MPSGRLTTISCHHASVSRVERAAGWPSAHTPAWDVPGRRLASAGEDDRARARSRSGLCVVLLSAAANAGFGEQTVARRQTCVFAGGADDGPHGADDNVGLSVDALDEVIAAQRDDVNLVGG
jgi:hypothetical protein